MKRIEAKKTLLKKIRLRFSRTGGLNVSAHPVNGLTINNKYGLRVSKSFKGLTLGFQGKNTVFRGRWSFLNGFLNINLSKKKGISFSTSFKFGAINWKRPQYSSFRFLGIQIRGKKAHEYAVIVFFIMIALYVTKITLNVLLLIVLFLIQLASNLIIIVYRIIQLCYNLIMYYIFEFFCKNKKAD